MEAGVINILPRREEKPTEAQIIRKKFKRIPLAASRVFEAEVRERAAAFVRSWENLEHAFAADRGQS
jgi:hypothetical protein